MTRGRLHFLFTLALVACAADTPQPDVATGEVGAWQAGPALPLARANHCTAVIDNWILVIGGNHLDAATMNFLATDEIHAAQLAPDGTVGAWQLAGHTNSPVTECNATSDGHHLYIADGIYDAATDGRKIWTGDLDATGMLTPLTAMGSLPDGVVAISTAAHIHDGNLMLMDTRLPMEGDTTVTLRTPLAAMSWSTDDWHINFRADAEYAFTDTLAITIGGYHDPAIGALKDVYVAPIGAAGVIGAPVAGPPLPTGVAFGGAVAADDWVFVVGGRAQVFGAPGTTIVYAAQIGSDGTLGAWQTKAALPMARTNFDLALVGDFLVITGGAASGPGDALVFSARVRYAPTVAQ